MAPLLLAFKLTSLPNNLYFKTAKNQVINNTFVLAFVQVIYSALIEKKIIIAYYFDRWDINIL